ncbi:hypothetical protein D3C87_111460 [compost metagenome]
MATEKNQKDRSSLFALLLFLGAGALVIMSLGPDPKPQAKSSSGAAAKSEKFEKNVNKHLMVTNDTMEMARQRMAIENAQLARDFSSTKPQKVYEVQSNGVDLSGDSHAADIANELGRGERQRVINSPHDVIQKELFNDQQNEAYTQAYKEEYARQFVENARKGGYKVQLNDEFKVISVTPIRKPTQNIDLFNAPAGEALQ